MSSIYFRFALVVCSSVVFVRGAVGQETQTFDSEVSASSAGWVANEEGQNPDRECDLCETDLGWRASDFAGGAAAGEGGGLLHRSGGLPIGFYGDTTIGELTLDMPISASGKVALVNTDFDGHFHFGFFDGKRLLDDALDYGAELGFFLAEPGGGVAPNFRWGHTVRSDTGVEDRNHVGFFDGAPDSESLDFFHQLRSQRWRRRWIADVDDRGMNRRSRWNWGLTCDRTQPR